MCLDTLWDYRYAQRTHQMRSSTIRELLKLTQQPDIISFAGGLPAPELFPVEEVKHAAQVVLEKHGAQALQYSTTEGFLPLREMICRHTGRYGLHVTPENVLITSGSQQALDLLGKILINPGDRILVEDPTYLGAIQAWNAYGAEYVTVPSDAYGMRTEDLEAALRTGPKFIYVLPNFQNPTGVTLSLERRQQLIALADQYGVPIIEDDPYGQLRYEEQHIRSVVALDSDYRGNNHAAYSGNVIYLSTFSKTLAPGLRLAWVVAPPGVIGKLVQAKQGADLHTPTFNQMVGYEVGKGGFIDQHVRLIRKVYGERRDLMLALMEELFPPEVSWTRPQGGLFLWVRLPAHLDAAEVLQAALKRKVAFVPGAPFHPLGGGHNTMRINFSNARPEQIEQGMQRLSETLKEMLLQV